MVHLNVLKLASASSRHMKYPYTFTAKLVQFPYVQAFRDYWFLRWWLGSVILCAPLFYKIQQWSFHPDNVAKWDAIHKKERTEKH